MAKNPALDMTHIQDALKQDIIIGSDYAKDGLTKRFIYNPWSNEFRISHGNDDKGTGKVMDAMLEQYNAI